MVVSFLLVVFHFFLFENSSIAAFLHEVINWDLILRVIVGLSLEMVCELFWVDLAEETLLVECADGGDDLTFGVSAVGEEISKEKAHEIMIILKPLPVSQAAPEKTHDKINL